MANINQTVWRILESDLAIQKDMKRDIINTRALARYLIETYPLKTRLDAVISAIRRFRPGTLFEEDEKKVLNIFKNSSIQTRNNMAIIEARIPHINFLKRFPETYKGQADLRLITGTHGMKLICESNLVDRLKAIFEENEFEGIIENISEMAITLSEEAVHTKGVLARIATEISLQNINLEEVIVCSPEVIIYVKDKDTAKAHKILLDLCAGG